MGVILPSVCGIAHLASREENGNQWVTHLESFSEWMAEEKT